MYFRLAMRNVKKSFKEYLIYFLTLAFSVCLFYTFNSFQDQQAVLEISDQQNDILQTLQILMQIISVIVALILAFLIKYANSFLIKRRKKEFGLYTLLGMPKPQMTRMLIYETFIVGVISLIVGIITGVIASQALTVFTAGLFDVALNYHFIFSMGATTLTIFAFAIIFFLIMLFNAFSLNHYKLIDLLTADRKNDTLKIKNIYVSVIFFLTSCALLGFAYYRAYVGGFAAFSEIMIIAPCGIIGTILFFRSLSGFLLKFVQCSKSIYYKRLNMFVLRQINASINSNYLSMSIVCIMLLFSIGALSTGANLNKTINNTIAMNTPYDLSYGNMYNENNIDNIIHDLGLDESLIQEEFFVREYEADTKISYFAEQLGEQYNPDFQTDTGFEVLPLSTYNKLREDREMPPITLNENEAYIYTTTDLLTTPIANIMDEKMSFPLYGKTLQVSNDSYDMIGLGTTTATGTFMFGFVVNDEVIPQDAKLYSMYWNVNLKEEAQIQPFTQTMIDNTKNLQEQDPNTIYSINYIDSRLDVYEVSKGMSVVLTYIGIYLGIIFLIASAVILALQQLSQASDSRQRYLILNKIGAEKRMITRSVLLQLSIYFFMPLLLGIVHSVFGVYVVNQLVMAFGVGDMFGASLITGSIIVFVYGAYFMITYTSYKRIITQP